MQSPNPTPLLATSGFLGKRFSCGWDPWSVIWAGCVGGGTVIREVEAFEFSDYGWLTGEGIAGVVPDPWYVCHPKAIEIGCDTDNSPLTSSGMISSTFSFPIFFASLCLYLKF